MTFAEKAYDIFSDATNSYHVADHVDAPSSNPHPEGSIEAVLWAKNYIDAVQWHLEDIIRDPDIDPVEALAIKRRIDKSNQDRTDMVEELDTFFRSKFADVSPLPDATINTESPAWALDRLRDDADSAHRSRCAAKLDVLTEQRADLISAIDRLLDDIAAGQKYMKVYRQMKMYNDPDTNPVLYGGKQ